MEKFKVLDLFSGIGGFSLGLERAGFETVAFCEIEKYCRAVLAERWPGVPIYDDIRTLTANRLAADGIAVDVLCGGFPCQDISAAGKGAGLAGARSGLWREFYRLICEVRPRYVIVENVSALLSRGLGTILGDLCSYGQWRPHEQAATDGQEAERNEAATNAEQCSEVVDSDVQGSQDGPTTDTRWGRFSPSSGWWEFEPGVGGGFDGVPFWLDGFIGWGLTHGQSHRCVQKLRELWNADMSQALWRAIGGLDRFSQAQILFAFVRQYEGRPDEARVFLESEEAFEAFVRSVWGRAKTPSSSRRPGSDKQRTLEHPDVVQVVSRLFTCDSPTPWHSSSWEDGINRVSHGVPCRVDRLKSLGNAVVPQVVEIIGRAILNLSVR